MLVPLMGCWGQHLFIRVDLLCLEQLRDNPNPAGPGGHPALAPQHQVQLPTMHQVPQGQQQQQNNSIM